VLDTHLKLLADASLDAEAAEAAVAEGAHHAATERLDTADAALVDLRAAWPDMSAPERAIVGPSAATLRALDDAARARIPRLSALSLGAPESDPDEEALPPD
jgi:hypothetical protein